MYYLQAWSLFKVNSPSYDNACVVCLYDTQLQIVGSVLYYIMYNRDHNLMRANYCLMQNLPRSGRK